ncbi:MAG: hypothetical protein VB089_01170 [Anaerolineaceae bacterium]|nr:hypothetical protein [Anaerolineaceae bacterium]
MNKLRARLLALRLPGWSVPLALAGVCVLSYGLLIPWLGFYWDDWAFVWISQKLGNPGLQSYFATNRPFWGMLYQLTTPWLAPQPWLWQAFGLLWRIACTLALWRVLRLTWPRHPQAAAWAGLLFAVYPGFTQQPIAITYGHFFIVLTAYFLSLACMLRAVQSPSRRLVYTALGLLLSLVNLLMMEYFFLLDLLRPVLLLAALQESVPDWRQRLRRSLLAWLPYLALFIGVAVWRAFFFEFQTQNYTPLFLQQLKTQPLAAVLRLLGNVLGDLWVTTFAAWGQVFAWPSAAEHGALTTRLWALVSAAAVAAWVAYLLLLRTPPDGQLSEGDVRRAWALPAVGVGLAGLLLAGWPFWLTQLPIGLVYPNNRFTLPFMLGASLLLAGLLRLLPLRQWMRLGLLGLALGMAVSWQFLQANTFRRDWEVQQNLFWQMQWRMPAIEPGTALLANDLPSHYSSDNSLTAPLNWIYAPDQRSTHMSYMLYYTSIRVSRAVPDLKPGLPIQQNYLAASFEGSTSQVIALTYQPPACLRVLDPEIDATNPTLPALMRSAAALSRPELAGPAPETAQAPLVEIYGAEPAHNWCYYFEKADLARQLEDWDGVAALGDAAFALGDYPNDAMERLPFIEGYAHTGKWTRALELTQEAGDITPLMQTPLCRLWQRIDRETPESPEKDTALADVYGRLDCSQP